MRTQTRRLFALTVAGVIAAASSICHAAEAADPKQPGLLGPDYGAILWVLVIFVLLVVILKSTAWKNVLAGLAAREARIRTDIAGAESARRKGESTLKEYNVQLAKAETQVRELLSTATVEAEKIAAGIKSRAQQEVEEIRERATKEIDTARKQAMTEVYEQTANLATLVAEKILRRNLNADDQRDLVNRSLEELQTVHT